MEIFFPYNFQRINGENEIVSMITTAKSTKNNNLILTMDEIVSMMDIKSSDVKILQLAPDANSNIYDEMILLLRENYICVLARIDFPTSPEQMKYSEKKIINILKNECMVNFRIILMVGQIEWISYNMTLDSSFSGSKTKIILINPILKLPSVLRKGNIRVVLFSPCDAEMRKKMEVLDPDKWIISDTDPSIIFSGPTSDINLIKVRSDHTSRLIASILKL
jgi:hypothetical protein